MPRITKKQLEYIVTRINDKLGMPSEPYAEGRDENGRLVANAGHYRLDIAYGGFRLARISEGGGEIDVSPRGTKHETYVWCEAFLAGVDAARN